MIESGQKVIQETRLFDPNNFETRSMRGKEESHDYRYFPDPDLPPLIIEQEEIDELIKLLSYQIKKNKDSSKNLIYRITMQTF